MAPSPRVPPATPLPDHPHAILTATLTEATGQPRVELAHHSK